jgi:hypothetical protein
MDKTVDYHCQICEEKVTLQVNMVYSGPPYHCGQQAIRPMRYIKVDNGFICY